MPNLGPGRDARIMGYLRLAEVMSLDVGHWSLDHEDLVQEATVAIIKAVDAWKPGKAPMNQYVQYHIRCALKKAIRRAVRATRDREDADLTTLSRSN